MKNNKNSKELEIRVIKKVTNKILNCTKQLQNSIISDYLEKRESGMKIEKAFDEMFIDFFRVFIILLTHYKDWEKIKKEYLKGVKNEK